MKDLMTEYMKVIQNNKSKEFFIQDYIKKKHLDAKALAIMNGVKNRYIKPLWTVVEKGGRLPERKHSDDLGLDFFPLVNYDLMPGTGERFETGIKMDLPKGGLFWDKSSSAWDVKLNRGRFVIVCGGAIDPAYRGELIVVLFNLGKDVFEIRKEKSFVQLITKGTPIEVEELSETSRGEMGFGESLGENK